MNQRFITGLAKRDFRITFDTTSNGVFRAIVSHPSGQTATFIGAVQKVKAEIDSWAMKVLENVS